jgi:hypothetical protein
MDEDERRALQCEGLDPDDPNLATAIGARPTRSERAFAGVGVVERVKIFPVRRLVALARIDS